MTLTVPSAVYQQIIDHCREGMPNEACGFLAGRNLGAERIYPLTNAAASPVYYRPADKEMIAAMRDIEDHSLELVCIFHSHVASAPYPSVTDVREAHYPDSAYLIVSMIDQSNPSSKAYFIRKKDWRDSTGEVDEIDLVIS